MGQQIIGLVSPVVEVTGDDEGRIGVGNALKVSRESIHLAAPRAGEHRKMDTDTVKRLRQTWQEHGAMQQATPLEPKLGDVLIVGVLNRKTGKDGIAMVPVTVDHVASIGGGLPNILGQEFMLGLVGPVFEFLGVPAVEPLDLLKKHNVWIKVPQPLPKVMHHQVLMELRKPLVDVVGDDVESHGIGGVHEAENILSCGWVATPPGESGF